MSKNGKPTRKALALESGTVTKNSCATLMCGNCQL